ncbi:MAG: hypothetical protein COZ16_05995 [Flavobacteriaceae bacterium CG_4_10_14_3_um_filter_31_253]|nr:MAG: hypothetical protein COW43_08890 [Flavobacteriaceae bacterium CG17_big_fil_post_rev_8_21_14_2_50_31_13]PIX14887.1 MAG: hypothetical protein COZ74_01755 [Flavobacteriaceae bacterium CG_4_8_14_3_um_filter_31_8]PIY15061.1 MAG: hypothetical protein COZ16_05995 [Flavobacteriaceae bacterium CG_4_10_14_3_um_filter_31_253]PIZ12402.1 MAG: hypothetical protein COY55_00065 [Flavobacteriaceae bacterium CG_4_10_14_0_8_um_filter_31_99]PJC10082.1 MAG: hypothetical protein CO067_06555 [Flavobacteriacea
MDKQKQMVRTFILDPSKVNFTLSKAIEFPLFFGENFEDYSITNTSMSTLLDGTVLLLVVFTLD